MRFGICFKGSLDPGRTAALCQQAEASGFTHAWFYDSHILWRDPYPAMAAGLARTRTLRFGPCVTNPDVRDWSVAASLFASLAAEGGNRIDMGVGRGDSSMRVMGRRPASVARLTRFVDAIKAMVRGDEVHYEGAAAPVRLAWATGYELPVWVAAYGPKALAAAGEHGDGLILQLADPDLCAWFGAQAVAAGRDAGLRPRRGSRRHSGRTRPASRRRCRRGRGATFTLTHSTGSGQAPSPLPEGEGAPSPPS